MPKMQNTEYSDEGQDLSQCDIVADDRWDVICVLFLPVYATVVSADCFSTLGLWQGELQ